MAMMMMTITMITARQKGKLLCWDATAVCLLTSSCLQYATASVYSVAELTAICKVEQEAAEMSHRGRTMLRVIDYFAKSLKITQDRLK